MRIAVVSPSPVPFGIGGMEYLLWGMQNSINNLTEHKAELIKLPTKETNFWEVINSYKQFYNLDLSHFDMVITTKYPAWMVQHPNHICYMAHRLRGLYDTYHFMNLPDKAQRNHPLISRVLDYIEDENSTISGLFKLLDECYAKRESLPQEHMAFPSPFAKEVIHFLDDRALRPTKKFYAISKTVKSRKEYFPKHAEVEVVYPPSALPRFENRTHGDYIFTISRLDGAKRISMIIEAMKHVKSDVKLKIAGTGPDEAKLKEMAKGDARIEFLGFVNDEDAIEYYADAKGVVFIPYEEDYGLVTIEAMMSHRPVITCYDSGGTTEFVEQGITGYISASEPTEIAKSIEALCALNEKELRDMGQCCYEKVKVINWETVAHSLTQQDNPLITQQDVRLHQMKEKKKSNKKKVVVTSTFPIYPPQGGGQARIYNLYKELAKSYEVEIVSFTGVDQPAFEGYIAEDLYETRIPKSIKHQEEESNIECQIGIPITDVVMPFVSKYTPEYGDALEKAIQTADLVVASHPFLIHEVKKYIGDKPFIYEAHNVEYLMKKELLEDKKGGKKLIDLVHDIERECCEKSEWIMTCSEEDKDKINEVYGISKEKMVVVPNGVDTSATKFTSMSQRQRNKAKLGLAKQKVGMFMGSWHPPNLEACEHIINMAKECPDTIFLLVGSQCLYFKEHILPENVGLLGLVSEEVKNDVFATVDFALNPMLSGSGTNLKMFDYMAAGIPVITTAFGTRGIDKKEYFMIAEVNEMPKVINKFELKNYNGDLSEVRKYVEDTFSWENIAKCMTERMFQ